MSRVAKNPITVPQGVEVKLDGQHLSVSGPKGKGVYQVHSQVALSIDKNVVHVAPTVGGEFANAQAGTTRANVNNLINGAHKGFERKLVLVGVGYRAQVQGRNLNLTLGFSHPVIFAIPEGITVEVPSQTEITIKGANRQAVGQIAANIRAIRPPEPYKGKGIRYADEVIELKETKKK
jgi:large subunit ribosomal protein L6